jgi:hypothetical protein
MDCGRGDGGRQGHREKGQNITKINCSIASYKVAVNNKILQAVEAPF